MNKGDLAWLPSRTPLVRFNKRGDIKTFKHTGRPKMSCSLRKGMTIIER